jgi:hypothetical protein
MPFQAVPGASTSAQSRPRSLPSSERGAVFRREGQLGQCSVQRDHLRICDNKLVCNRYRLTHSKQYLAERFEASNEIEDRPRYNIAPTQPVVTVRREMGKKTRKFTTMRWGLIPFWAKDIRIGTRTLNARSETVTTTRAFRNSILTKRCLIPADGFYEWVRHEVACVIVRRAPPDRTCYPIGSTLRGMAFRQRIV